MESEPSAQRQVAIRVARSATEVEKDALRQWATKLLEINASNLSTTQKAKETIAVTVSSSVIVPSVKIMARELKKLAWDQRSLSGRLGLGGALVGATLFGGQNAGIVALGTGIGVPLWVVFGSGAAFLGVLLKEIAPGSSMTDSPQASYRIIDAKRED